MTELTPRQWQTLWQIAMGNTVTRRVQVRTWQLVTKTFLGDKDVTHLVKVLMKEKMVQYRADKLWSDTFRPMYLELELTQLGKRNL